MNADGLSLATTIILIFPMLYFLIATLTFFLMKFSDATVTWMLRGLFNVYFLTVTGTFALAALAFARAGRPAITLVLGALALLAMAARRWFLSRMDAQLRARERGDAGAVQRLRRLQLGGMAYNATQLALVLASIPFVFRPGA